MPTIREDVLVVDPDEGLAELVGRLSNPDPVFLDVLSDASG